MFFIVQFLRYIYTTVLSHINHVCICNEYIIMEQWQQQDQELTQQILHNSSQIYGYYDFIRIIAWLQALTEVLLKVQIFWDTTPC